MAGKLVLLCARLLRGCRGMWGCLFRSSYSMVQTKKAKQKRHRMKSPHQNVMINLPDDAASRKEIPITTGLLDYFPAACAEVAKVSKAGNEQHNPGQPLNWAREKSRDQSDTIVRHLMQRGTIDSDGTRHSAKMAWRALALLQEELEAAEGFEPDKPAEGPAPARARRSISIYELEHSTLSEATDVPF